MLAQGLAWLIGISSILLIPDFNTAIYSAVVALFIFLLLISNNSLVIKGLRLLALTIFGVVWGCAHIIWWQFVAAETIRAPLKTQVSGYICSIPQYQQNRIQFDFCVEKIAQHALEFGQFDRVKASWSLRAKPPITPLQAGQYWQLSAHLKPPHGRFNPGGFDLQKWMLSQGYAGSAQIKSGSLTTGTSLGAYFHRKRHSIYQYLHSLMPDSPYRGMLLALAMGERGEMSHDQWDVLKHSGTSHLLAISGLHVGVAAMWSYWLMLFVWRQSERLCLVMAAPKVAQIGALLGGLSILLLSGMGLPAIRAFFMLSLWLLTQWCGFKLNFTSLIGIALLVILFFDPFAVLAASFWLSFCAVTVIGIALSKRTREPSKWLSWGKVNGLIYLAMLPIALIFFNMMSFVALLANLLLVPLASLVLIPLIYAAMLVSVISAQFASVIFSISTVLLEYLFLAQQFFAALNQQISPLNIQPLGLILLMILVAMLFVPARLFAKSLFIAPMILFVLLLQSPRISPLFAMTVFDIGQGLAVYIETKHGNLLFDTGWGQGRYAIANSTLLPFFKSNGIIELDKLVISHNDADHAGGKDAILANLVVKELIVGEVTHQPSQINCHQYPGWYWGEISFEFLPHLEASRLKGNNASCVLSIRFAGSSILLTGDIERVAERALIERGLNQHHIVLAPHHGSNTSSHHAFIKKLNPHSVIFSSGYANRWGFPKTKVVERYLDQGAKVWTTHLSGAIQVEGSDKMSPLTISEHRAKNRHFWLQ